MVPVAPHIPGRAAGATQGLVVMSTQAPEVLHMMVRVVTDTLDLEALRMKDLAEPHMTAPVVRVTQEREGLATQAQGVSARIVRAFAGKAAKRWGVRNRPKSVSLMGLRSQGRFTVSNCGCRD